VLKSTVTFKGDEVRAIMWNGMKNMQKSNRNNGRVEVNIRKKGTEVKVINSSFTIKRIAKNRISGVLVKSHKIMVRYFSVYKTLWK